MGGYLKDGGAILVLLSIGLHPRLQLWSKHYNIIKPYVYGSLELWVCLNFGTLLVCLLASCKLSR